MADSNTKTGYAYVITLVGVVLAAVLTAYNVVRSYLISQMFRSRPFNPGNFNQTQFGTYTRVRPFAPSGFGNPYGGLTGGLMILAVVIALVGVVWLGLALRKPKPKQPSA